MTNFHRLALEALSLDEGDRLRLATELIDSVDGVPDAAWDEAWLAEIRARRAQGGEAIPWAEARERILRRLAHP